MGMYTKPGEKYVDGIDCQKAKDGLTKQSFAAEVDINAIIAKFARTGMVEHLNSKTPFYGDVSEISSYQESLNVVQEANDLFNGLSASVRERFANDPARMIMFLEDSSNYDEALKMGLIVERPSKTDVVGPSGPVGVAGGPPKGPVVL